MIISIYINASLSTHKPNKDVIVALILYAHTTSKNKIEYNTQLRY